MYVDGVLVGKGLSMRGEAPALNSFEMSGSGVADDLRITTSRPLGLSSDGDALPDEWEIEHFGELSHDGSEDSDGDGMSDLVEFRAGTDPLAHNGDTDGDGLPDWWEAANGLNPLGTNGFARAAFRETFEESAVSPGVRTITTLQSPLRGRMPERSSVASSTRARPLSRSRAAPRRTGTP